MDKKIILYIIISIVIFVLLLFTFFPNMVYVFRDSGSNSNDICSPPPGQTEEAWREHMGHHPEMYKGC